MYAIQGAVGEGGCKERTKCCFQEGQFYKHKTTCTLTNFYLVSEAPKDHIRWSCRQSKKSSEIHLKLDNCQLNRISVDISNLLATWPEFWAIGLSFLGFISNFAFLIMWPLRQLCPPP